MLGFSIETMGRCPRLVWGRAVGAAGYFVSPSYLDPIEGWNLDLLWSLDVEAWRFEMIFPRRGEGGEGIGRATPPSSEAALVDVIDVER
jgi:hypothetical protein